MIRPSLLLIAEHCGHAPYLAEEYPESSAAAEAGKEIHRQIAEAWEAANRSYAMYGVGRSVHDAIEVLALIEADGGTVIGLEQPITLKNSKGEPLWDGARGRADVLAVDQYNRVLIIDWKTGRPEFVEPPDDNLQLHAYALGACQDLGKSSYVLGLVFLSDTGADQRWSAEYKAGPGPIMNRILKAAARDTTPVRGDHCERCYQRRYCRAWMLPAHEGGGGDMVPFTGPGPIAPDKLLRGIQAVKQLEDALKVVKARIKSEIRSGVVVPDSRGYVYGPYVVAGSKDADVEALERDGLTRYIRQGSPYERWGWRKP